MLIELEINQKNSPGNRNDKAQSYTFEHSKSRAVGLKNITSTNDMIHTGLHKGLPLWYKRIKLSKDSNKGT